MAKLSGTAQDRATTHIETLAREGRISVTWFDGSPEDAEAFHTQRAIRTPLLRTGADYLVALHELGHCLSRGARALDDTDDARAIACEGWAWAWAIEHADPRIPLRATDFAAAGRFFASHLRWHSDEATGRGNLDS